VSYFAVNSVLYLNSIVDERNKTTNALALKENNYELVHLTNSDTIYSKSLDYNYIKRFDDDKVKFINLQYTLSSIETNRNYYLKGFFAKNSKFKH
jgi:hypothetical protein